MTTLSHTNYLTTRITDKSLNVVDLFNLQRFTNCFYSRISDNGSF